MSIGVMYVVGVEPGRIAELGPQWAPVGPRCEMPRWPDRPSAGMAEHTVSVAEAAAILGCSPDAVRRRIRAGEIDTFAERGAWRVIAAEALVDGGASEAQRGAAPSLADRLADRPWLLSPEDVAAVIGWPEDQVRYYLRRGQLPGRKVGARWVCPQDALIDWCGRPAA